MASEKVTVITDGNFADTVLGRQGAGARGFLGGLVHAVPADRADRGRHRG